uniref:Tyrosine-protein kinase n=1 Tax=Panagrellus redivivus TaxID=6233 RepID=A0A7E4UQQ5_PANRE
MGSCFSRPPRDPGQPLVATGGPATANGHPINAGHRMLAQMSLYKDDSFHRKISAHANGNTLYHVSSPHLPHGHGTMGSNTSRGGQPHQIKVIALYPYESRVDGDISFAKDDVMLLLDEGNADWWYVKHPKNGTGFAPRNFIARTDSVETQEWYAGHIARSMAEKLVCAPHLPRGTFLVRRRDQDNEYALTINDTMDNHRRGPAVKHYKIKPFDDGCGYYITTKQVFPTVQDLVSFYTESSAGLCCKLTYPAPRIAPQRTDLSSDTRTNWEIPRSEVRRLEKLGNGNFGEVYFGRWRDIVDVAIKTLKPGTMSKEAFLREAQIMKQCNHPKLVKLYAVCTREEPLYIVTEFMRNGSLVEYLKKPDQNISQNALIDISAQIAFGMMYLEGLKLVHRDLAARNILVGEIISGVPDVKIADFGLARTLMEENIYEAATGAKFPIKWTAIESAIYGNFTTKSDVWSYGILLYEIFTRSAPYPGMSNKQVIEEVERGYRMPRAPEIDEPVYAQMLKCWDVNPEARPTFEYLHHFFDDYFVAAQPSYVPSSVDEPSSFGAYRR